MSTEQDAARYRHLRRLAVQAGSLECFVAMQQLDFFSDEGQFDREVDKDIGALVGADRIKESIDDQILAEIKQTARQGKEDCDEEDSEPLG